ncbi:hypothetical protein EK904_013876 [Melospiza melodia maxima]|nr:hypothetical protein EK904_013876 [Melospiza melodia maxima]
MVGTRMCQLCLAEVATTERLGHHRLLQTLLPSGTGQLVPHDEVDAYCQFLMMLLGRGVQQLR